MYADKGVIFEHVLKPVIFGELDGVELTQFDLAPLPFSEQLIEHILATIRLALNHNDASLGGYLVGDFARVGRY